MTSIDICLSPLLHSTKTLGVGTRSQVTGMQNIFYYASAFNQDISSWDTSQVTSTYMMFYSASSFNQDISSWDTSQVKNMQYMFSSASAFNQPIGSWDTSQVTNIRYIFRDADSFAYDISGWDTSSVMYFDYMFERAFIFQAKFTCADQNNGPPSSCSCNSDFCLSDATFDAAISGCLAESPVDGLCTTYGLSTKKYGTMPNWDVSNVQDMRDAFKDREGFNADISGWDTSSVTTMTNMFSGASTFQAKFTCADQNNGPPSSCSCNSDFCLSDATFDAAISGCLAESPVDGLCTTYGLSTKKYGTMPNWDVSNVQDMRDAFKDREGFNADISGWDTSSVTTMTNMFFGTKVFQVDISSWITSSITTTTDMFSGASTFQAKFTCADQDSGPPRSCSCNSDFCLSDATFDAAISGCLAESPVDGLCTTYGLSTKKYGTMPNWDVSNVQDMRDAFKDREGFNADISGWDTSSVTTMRYTFYRAISFNQSISFWDTYKVKYMDMMFYYASAFNQDISSWDTSQVKNMYYMFGYASAFNQDISSWDTSQVTSMYHMFGSASSFNQPIGSWDTSRVNDMSYLFYLASAFNHDVSSWTGTGAETPGV